MLRLRVGAQMRTVLFSTEKWLNVEHPEMGLCPHEYGVIGSLATSGMGIVAQFHWDEFIKQNPDGDVDAALIKRCEQSKPAMVLATHVIQYAERNVKADIYGHIRDELKIPVVMLWGESAPDVVAHADALAPHVTLNLWIDTRAEWSKHTKFPEKCLRLFEPKDAALFNCDGDARRDIPLSFVGASFGRMDRSLNLGFLSGRSVGYFKAGGQRENPLSPADYAGFLKRSVVTMNFSSAVTFQHLTGRVIEAALCGAMLLESENSETSELLDPYADYVPFKEPFHWIGNGQIGFQDGDLAEKATHYAYQKPDEARAIAESGRRKVLERCDGREFWGKLFEALGIKDEDPT